MTARMLVNGVATEQISTRDRGFGYGDGLFESIRLVGTRAPLWARHMQRLATGCERLLIPAPDPDRLWHETQQVQADMAHAVVRITVTRGIGERGYAPPATPRPTRVVAAFPAPPVAEAAIHGVRMRLCRLRLAEQPRLAGIKHLNRLEQVLARADQADAFEQAVAITEAAVEHADPIRGHTADQQPRRHQPGAPSARSRPRALARVSSSSAWASESATMPAPARRLTRSPVKARVRIRMFKSSSPLQSR